MMDKFRKILDKAIERMPSGIEVNYSDNIAICGYPVDDIFDSPALQDKLYDLLYPPKAQVTGIRTMGIEEIRSRG